LACNKLVHCKHQENVNCSNIQRPFDTLALVVIMSRASSAEVLAATARRTEITNALLELLTSDAISTKELQHYRFVGDIFSIAPVIQELCSGSSTIEARTEKALACAMAALAIAIDDTPPAPTERQLARREERREAREAERAFKQSLAAGKGAKPAASSKEDKPLKIPGRTSKYYHAKRAKMTEAELAADRAKRAAVMREIRA
jgi:hypothetical protein